jgi:alpha-glucosidase (family GH31 glycosyl hydrolase)
LQVWNLAPDPAHYDAIVSAMQLREDIRDYVVSISQEHAETGMPMMRPMWMQFPGDAACLDPRTEAQYMFGASWLVAPVTAQGAASWSVYLPKLSGSAGGYGANGTWVYWFNQTAVPDGQWVSVNTPINEFPLFYLSVAS